ncbi:MAG TPA: hypothetical protein VGP72_29710 [Planctomycetota bacterium]
MGFGGFSWKRAVGISAAKARFARATGIPTSRTGRDAKLGRMLRGGGFFIPLVSGGETSGSVGSFARLLGLGLFGLLIYAIFFAGRVARPPETAPVKQPAIINTAKRDTSEPPLISTPPPPEALILPKDDAGEHAVIAVPVKPPEAPQDNAPATNVIQAEEPPTTVEVQLQKFVDAGFIATAALRGDVARVRVTKKFKGLDEEEREFMLGAYWTYFYEDKPKRTKLTVADETYKEIGSYDQVAGWVGKEVVASPKTEKPIAAADPAPSDATRYYSAGGTFRGSSASRMPSAGGTLVRSYVKKDGTVVRSHWRH